MERAKEKVVEAEAEGEREREMARRLRSFPSDLSRFQKSV